MENRAMSFPVSKLAEVDPVFREVVSMLYPAMDPRELWDLSKSMPGQSDTHVNATNQRRKKVGLAAGLVAGSVAEGLSVTRAAQRAVKVPGLKPKGELAFQAGNMAVGLLAAKELVRKPKRQAQETTLTKADFEPIIKARQEGRITTEKALELIEMIEKGVARGTVGFARETAKIGGAAAKGQAKLAQGLIFKPGAKVGKEAKNTIGAVRGLHETMSMAPFVAASRGAEAANFSDNVAQVANRSRLAMGGGIAVGAAAVGHHRGKQAAQKQINPSMGLKKNDEMEYEWTGEITKFDDSKRQVFGWCSLSTVDGQPVVDLQNDYVPIDEIEKSAYDYVRNSRKGGDMHARVGEEPLHTSDMIESMIVTPEKLKGMGFTDEAIAKAHTGWWVGFQVNDDEQWQKVRSGERTGFSIHGTGKRLSKTLED